jgi:DNA-binding GntR family transcriptional regulator
MANQKYTDILEKVQEDIRSGRYIPGQRLPSETELVRRYGASRMTVFRAMLHIVDPNDSDIFGDPLGTHRIRNS